MTRASGGCIPRNPRAGFQDGAMISCSGMVPRTGACPLSECMRMLQTAAAPLTWLCR